MIVKFTGRLLCKRDDVIPYDYLTEGKWYQVIPYRNETTAMQLGGPNSGKMITMIETDDKCFHVIDNRGTKHCFHWSDSEETPRSYLKWFHHYSYERESKIDNILVNEN